MRQRNGNNITASSKTTTTISTSDSNSDLHPQVRLASSSSDHDDDDDDEEQRIQTSHPPIQEEQRLPHHDLFSSNHNNDNNTNIIHLLQQQQQQQRQQHIHLARLLSKNLWNIFLSGGNTTDQWWVHLISISITAILTYSFNNSGGQINVQIAIMTVIILVGATAPTHISTAAIGAFVGGQNIIGATNDLEPLATTSPTVVSYGWLLLLALIVSWLWRYTVQWKILDGYAGRLGTTAFVGMNLVMDTMWGPLRVVAWNRYYLGFQHVIHVADEADNPSLASAWTWTEQAELVAGYVGGVVWLATISGATRIWNDRYIQQWYQQQQNNRASNTTSTPNQPPQTLNNVLVPCLWALFSMMVTNMTQYQHAPGIYNGFAVGAYVGMASLEKIGSILHFASVGLVAAGWGLALTPIFVGFAGKAGFTAMCGHATHRLILEPVVKNFRIRRLQQQQQQQQQQEEDERREHMEDSDCREELQSLKRHQQQPHDHDNSGHFEKRHHHHPTIEVVNYTKQQRRQQQRLLHRQQQHQQTTPLHHRSWVAQSDHWEHPKLDESSTIGNEEP
jgi:hypothetical protein